MNLYLYTALLASKQFVVVLARLTEATPAARPLDGETRQRHERREKVDQDPTRGGRHPIRPSTSRQIFRALLRLRGWICCPPALR